MLGATFIPVILATLVLCSIFFPKSDNYVENLQTNEVLESEIHAAPRERERERVATPASKTVELVATPSAKPTSSPAPTPQPTVRPTPEPTPAPQKMAKPVESNNLPLKAICHDGSVSYQDDASKGDYRGMCSGHDGIKDRLGRQP